MSKIDKLPEAIDKNPNRFPMISIIITNLNGKKWLEVCLPSIIKSTYPKDRMEVILVDNGSTDGSVDYFEQMMKSSNIRYKVIKNRYNVGWSPANNQGAKIAEGEILIFISNDIEVSPKAFEEVVNLFINHQNIGIVQFNSLSLYDRKTIDSAMNFIDIFGFAYGYAPLEKPWIVSIAEGMAFAIRRNVFFRIGGFDSDYFMEYDDMDLSLRTWLIGYKVVFHPQAIVYHARGGTVGAHYFVRKLKNIKNYTRNHIYTLLKVYEAFTLIKVLSVVLFLQILKMIAVVAIFKKPWVSKAIFRGIKEALINAKYIMRVKRPRVQALRKISDKELKKILHPFNPVLLFRYIIEQHRGKRFYIHSRPPVGEPI